jgi:selenocysteine lyase/cysteine desulfurase
VVTHASNICGTVNDIAEISQVCRAASVPLLVDGAQTAGVVPIDIEALGLDFFACAGHKGLLGPQGTGLLYVKDKDSLPAVVSGGTGSLSDSIEQPDFTPDKFESGTPNIIGIAGLAEGCRFLLDRGVESILRHDRRLLEIFLDMLTGIDGITLYGTGDAASSTGILSLNIEGLDSSETGSRLEKQYGIQTRIGLHCAPEAHKTIGTYPGGTVRFSWGWKTSEQDIRKTAEAVIKISRVMRRQG